MKRPDYIFSNTPHNLWQIMDWIMESPTYYRKVEDSVLIACVAARPGILEYITCPSAAVMEAAVRFNPKNIGRINRPTKEVQLIAVSLMPEMIEEGGWITKPCKEAIALAALLS